MDDSVDLSGVRTTRTLHQAAREHLRPATARETVLHEFSSANVSHGQFEQVLQQRHVADGAWTDLLDHDGPLSEALERPEGNDLGDEGPGGQTPATRVRYRQKSNPTNTAALVEQNESAFTIQDEEEHKVWQEFSRRQKLQ